MYRIFLLAGYKPLPAGCMGLASFLKEREENAAENHDRVCGAYDDLSGAHAADDLSLIHI